MAHEHAAVLELIETALRERGARVLATLDAREALEIVRRLKLDLVVLTGAHSDLAGDVRALQSGLRALVLGDEPMSLAEIEAAVFTALERRYGA